MTLITIESGYGFWYGFDESGTPYYNVLPLTQSQPSAGYYNSDYICEIKGFKNLFKP